MGGGEKENEGRRGTAQKRRCRRRMWEAEEGEPVVRVRIARARTTRVRIWVSTGRNWGGEGDHVVRRSDVLHRSEVKLRPFRMISSLA
eukprot:751870-Hanusia_phi.AAC.1